MIAASLLGFQDVIAQAQSIGARLAAELEGMDRARAARCEQVNCVAVPLGFEELPNRFRFHEPRGFLFHCFHIVEQFERLRVAFGQQLLEISLESKVPAVQHERIDIAPDFSQIRDIAYAAV
jgi:hypothetical protein